MAFFPSESSPLCVSGGQMSLGLQEALASAQNLRGTFAHLAAPLPLLSDVMRRGTCIICNRYRSLMRLRSKPTARNGPFFWASLRLVGLLWCWRNGDSARHLGRNKGNGRTLHILVRKPDVASTWHWACLYHTPSGEIKMFIGCEKKKFLVFLFYHYKT